MSLDFQQTYLNFWAEMFGLSLTELQNSEPQVTSKGYYLERHQNNFIFLYEDLIQKKILLAANESLLKTLNLSRLDLRASSSNIQAILQNKQIAFEDIDYTVASRRTLNLAL